MEYWNIFFSSAVWEPVEYKWDLCLFLNHSSKHFEFKYPLLMKGSIEGFSEIFVASIKFVMKCVGGQNQVDSQIWSKQLEI